MTLISFTIAGTTYHAEEGMTWEQWVNSDYNTIGATIQNNLVVKCLRHVIGIWIVIR